MSAIVDDEVGLDASKLLAVLRAVRRGDFSVRLPENWTGVAGKVADTLNEVIELNQHFAAELARLNTSVGERGRLQERANVGSVSGAWGKSITNVTSLIASLGQPTSEAARVIGAVAKGDLSQRIALEIDGRSLEGEFVEADTARMEQVITNLLVNAVKYTEAGGRIEVEVGTEGMEAVVRVRDTGVGMSGEMRRRLFQPFAQEPQPLDRARGGLGLGLVLVRQLVELHGGQVEAESAGAGRGSTFTVRLPRASPAPPPRRDDPDSLRGEAPLRILIVEDNADAREMLRTLLELARHETYEAADGMEGLRMASEVKPQVTLVDLGLPELDGLELAGRIRAIPGGEAIALVALTGSGQQQDRQRTRAAGFDHHLVKPVDSETLGKVLALAARRLAPETGRQLSR